MSAVKVFGVPFSVGTRSETAPVLDQQNGPLAIRRAFKRLFANFDIESDFDDLGDIQAGSSVGSVLQSVENHVLEIRSGGFSPVMLGGSHTSSLAALRAISKLNPDFSLVYFDTHPDVMPRNQIDYGSFVFHAFQEGVLDPKRVFFVGLRQVENPEWKVIREYNIPYFHALDFERLSAQGVLAQIKERLEPPYYLSIDLDVLDPAEAPGVTTPFPGGLSARELLFLTSELCKSEVIGLDIVELSPLNDRNEETAAIAASLLSRLTRLLATRSKKH